VVARIVVSLCSVFISSVFEGMLKTSISISRSIFFGLLVFQGLPISSLSYNFFVPRIGFCRLSACLCLNALFYLLLLYLNSFGCILRFL
jgi:hypothetical protein